MIEESWNLDLQLKEAMTYLNQFTLADMKNMLDYNLMDAIAIKKIIARYSFTRCKTVSCLVRYLYSSSLSFIDSVVTYHPDGSRVIFDARIADCLVLMRGLFEKLPGDHFGTALDPSKSGILRDFTRTLSKSRVLLKRLP
jgi:hypothetical protein